MLNLPKPTLGDASTITIASPDLDTTSQFYQQLGFTELWRSDYPFPCMQMSDGALLLFFRKNEDPYIGITYYTMQINETVTALEKEGIIFIEKPKGSEMIQRYRFQSPDGLNISLIPFMDGFSQPPGPTLLTMQQQDYFNPDKYVNKVCGMFGEFCHPVSNLDKSIAFWEKLGFKTMSKLTTYYPWAILSDGLNIVGLHQTKEFTYPAITFFAADMKEKIARLKEKGIQNYKEKGQGSIILQTPEQQHIFLFKLGM